MIALLFLIAFTSVDCRSNRQEIEISNEDGNRIADEKSHGRNLTSPEPAVNGVLNVLVGYENRTLIGNGRLRINTKRNALKEINEKPIVVVFHEDKTLDGIEEQGKIFEEMKNITQQEKYNSTILVMKYEDLSDGYKAKIPKSVTIMAYVKSSNTLRLQNDFSQYNKTEFEKALGILHDCYVRGHLNDSWEVSPWKKAN
ncbi:hypothetical protein ACOME3_000460 [Neoechinorhynchus agilis]